MKRLTSVALLSLLMIFAYAQKNSGIKFNEGSWTEITKKAKKAKKLIFVECYTVW